MSVYLRAKFEVFRIILTSFRQREEGGGVILPPPPPTSKRTLKKAIQIRVKKSTCNAELKECYFLCNGFIGNNPLLKASRNNVGLFFFTFTFDLGLNLSSTSRILFIKLCCLISSFI